MKQYTARHNTSVKQFSVTYTITGVYGATVISLAEIITAKLAL